MRRRAFIALLGGAVAPPLVARAQQKPTPLVGVLRMAPAALDPFLAPFRGFMAELGWEEGRSVAFRVLHADGEDARMPELARVLALSEARVLVTTGTVSLRALKDATAVIPIVGVGEDFVGAGFARSMARPGGNVTGISILATELDAKRLEVLRAALPAAERVGLISDPSNPLSSERWQGIEQTARRLEIRLEVFEARSAAQLERTLDALVRARLDGVCVLSSPVLNAARDQIVAGSWKARLPAIYQWTDTARRGGLLAYGPSLGEAYQRVAVLVDPILRGAKPADLPIEQPTRVELIVNLKVAKELGLTLPASLLARADEVIE